MSGEGYDENIHAQIAVIAGILGFFIGGLVSMLMGTGEIVRTFLYASIAGVLIMLFAYFVSKLVTVDLTTGHEEKPYKSNAEVAPEKSDKSEKAKGQKIDFVIKD